jgi:hypothetical protein
MPHLHMLKPLLDIYERCGVDQSLKPKRRSTKQPEEVEPSTWTDATEQAPLELPSAEPKKKTAKELPPASKTEDQIMVTCLLQHSNGKAATVQYRSRNSHAKEAHNGAKTWDIEWGDPAGALRHACEMHAQCMKVKLAFPSETSLSRHIRMCPLERLPEVA